MEIGEIYKQYPIHRGLQEHMIRVASVAKLICDNSIQKLDTDTIVSACLLHDMGNLIKVKMDIAPELFDPEGPEYWQKQQAKMIEQYGTNVHAATIAMVKEIGVSERIVNIIDEASFEELVKVAASGSTEAKVLEYADMRVGLHGIISLDKRFDDAIQRYVPRRHSREDMEIRRKAAKKIEHELFLQAHITPEDVTDTLTARLQNELWNWEIITSP